MVYAEIILGIALLLGGGEALVRGSIGLARRLGVSPLIIGLTLVGFGTSTPELAASIEAALADAPGIVVGNILGSNVANVLLILGASAAIAPIACDPRAFTRDGSVLAVSTAAFAGVVLWMETAGPVLGVVFVAALVAYVVWTYLHDRRANDAAAALHAQEAELGGTTAMHPLVAALLAAAGIVAILAGARMLVGSAITLAAALGVPETVVGLTVVALGTSLPELATGVMAARKGEGALALGNVIGSNIFNVLGIFGVTALVKPVRLPTDLGPADVAVFVLATLMLIAFAVTGWRFTRGEGFACLAGYAVFVGLVVA